MKASEVDQKVKLHLKDYEVIREDVNKIQSWSDWALKIILSVLLLGLLALLGLKT